MDVFLKWMSRLDVTSAVNCVHCVDGATRARVRVERQALWSTWHSPTTTTIRDRSLDESWSDWEGWRNDVRDNWLEWYHGGGHEETFNAGRTAGIVIAVVLMFVILIVMPVVLICKSRRKAAWNTQIPISYDSPNMGYAQGQTDILAAIQPDHGSGRIYSESQHTASEGTTQSYVTDSAMDPPPPYDVAITNDSLAVKALNITYPDEELPSYGASCSEFEVDRTLCETIPTGLYNDGPLSESSPGGERYDQRTIESNPRGGRNDGSTSEPTPDEEHHNVPHCEPNYGRVRYDRTYSRPTRGGAHHAGTLSDHQRQILITSHDPSDPVDNGERLSDNEPTCMTHGPDYTPSFNSEIEIHDHSSDLAAVSSCNYMQHKTPSDTSHMVELKPADITVVSDLSEPVYV